MCKGSRFSTHLYESADLSKFIVICSELHPLIRPGCSVTLPNTKVFSRYSNNAQIFCRLPDLPLNPPAHLLAQIQAPAKPACLALPAHLPTQPHSAWELVD